MAAFTTNLRTGTELFSDLGGMLLVLICIISTLYMREKLIMLRNNCSSYLAAKFTGIKLQTKSL